MPMLSGLVWSQSLDATLTEMLQLMLRVRLVPDALVSLPSMTVHTTLLHTRRLLSLLTHAECLRLQTPVIHLCCSKAAMAT